ncbi:phosphatidate cytidylyltransferase Ptp4 [Gigaspora margarita]|uniref:Phosphatidate cytidylyltransferase Ptp4 n=1 Tax=Gigaspora margarita TaxID=4874 RepID=A0A8H4ELL2_GIGMA|nr:phosphatidate cytidylyltransferase Ptp4 [Gigaspora margarita]
MAIHRNITSKGGYHLKHKLKGLKKRKKQGLTRNDEDNNIQRTKKNWEIPRKLLHASIGFLVLYIYPSAEPIQTRNILLIVFVIVSIADLLRFNSVSFNNLYIKVLGFLMRESEKYGKINGVVFYLAGCIGVLSIFPKDIAAISILILSWCDTAASIVGRKYGHYTYRYSNGKTLAGTLGAITVGSITALVFWGGGLQYHKIDVENWIPDKSVLSFPTLCLITGIISGVSELIDLGGLDDNLVMPLASGSLLWIILVGLGLGGSTK